MAAVSPATSLHVKESNGQHGVRSLSWGHSVPLAASEASISASG